MKVDKIQYGIVIDHIRPKLGYKLFQYLRLYDVDYPTALICGVDSKKYGKKDILKIQNVLDLNLSILGLLDPNITINIIKDEGVDDKIKLELPNEIAGVMKCTNDDCISTQNNELIHVFELVNERKGIYKCSYCMKLYNWEDKVEPLVSNIEDLPQIK